ncbi:DUF1232 domain-containing protein [Bacillus timonensis]|nr:DUF1232 domain-containing protein [Bacillus timonensis]
MRKIWKRMRFVLNVRKFIPFMFEFFLSKDISITKKLVSVLAIIGYFLLPFDIIPDFLTIFGLVDDVAVFLFILQQIIKISPKYLQDKYGFNIKNE